MTAARADEGMRLAEELHERDPAIGVVALSHGRPS